MGKRFFIFAFALIAMLTECFASVVLIPMDAKQKNHLKAYGVAYEALQRQIDVDWMLNYRGGSFALQENEPTVRLCRLRGVTYEIISDIQYANIQSEIADPEINMDIVQLQKAPKIAVYSPKSKRPWDDAVTLVLTYAQIPYDVVYDQEVLDGKLPLYDWLHLHHEDFTGQHGKFWASYRTTAWYKEEVAFQENLAASLGYKKVATEIGGSKTNTQLCSRRRIYVCHVQCHRFVRHCFGCGRC